MNKTGLFFVAMVMAGSAGAQSHGGGESRSRAGESCEFVPGLDELNQEIRKMTSLDQIMPAILKNLVGISLKPRWYSGTSFGGYIDGGMIGRNPGSATGGVRRQGYIDGGLIGKVVKINKISDDMRFEIVVADQLNPKKEAKAREISLVPNYKGVGYSVDPGKMCLNKHAT